tara:strand:+ start:583 stop:909 length:327 start_codon:yes stop_codon:yes gene_type:complete
MVECTLKDAQWVFDASQHIICESKPTCHTGCDEGVVQCDYCHCNVCDNHLEKRALQNGYGYYMIITVCNACIAINEDVACKIDISCEALEQLRKIHRGVMTKHIVSHD